MEKCCKICGSTEVVTRGKITFNYCEIHYKENYDSRSIKMKQASICAKEKRKQTCLLKYGTENANQNNTIKHKSFITRSNKSKEEKNSIIQKRKITTLKKYGTENVFQCDTIKEKVKQTCLKKYGVTFAIQSKEVQTKNKETLLQKYGVITTLQLPEVKKKILKTRKEHRWDLFISQLHLKNITPLFNKEYFITHNIFEYKCNLCNSTFKSTETNIQSVFCRCTSHTSSYEQELYDFLKPFSSQIKQNYRPLFENEWINKKEIVKSIILNIIGQNKKVFGRKCKLKEISFKKCFSFLEMNHIQGSVPSKINIGLFYNNELISVGTFGKSRFKINEMELLRYSCKLNTTIIGGFSKILKYYIQKYKPTTLITYCDLRYFTGDGYCKNGFHFIHQTKPNYFYFKNSSLILESRIKYQKHKLSTLLSKFDPLLSEQDNMKNNNYRCIYDVGNLKFEYSL